MDEPLLLQHRDERGVIALTLNRPQALNAVNSALSDAVGDYLEQAAADPQVRAIVVTGAGRAFCAGADLKACAKRPRRGCSSCSERLAGPSALATT